MTVTVDGEITPAEFAPHLHYVFNPTTVLDEDGRLADAPTVAVECDCGWAIGAEPQANAWRAWLRHLPAGYLAWHQARARWLVDHAPLKVPGDGWDAPGGAYDWRSWTTEITEDGYVVRFAARREEGRPA